MSPRLCAPDPVKIPPVTSFRLFPSSLQPSLATHLLFQASQPLLLPLPRLSLGQVSVTCDQESDIRGWSAWGQGAGGCVCVQNGWLVSTWTLEGNCQVQTLVPQFVSCMSLGKAFSFSVPQFTHLSSWVVTGPTSQSCC